MRINSAFLVKGGYCGMEFKMKNGPSIFVHEDHLGIHVSEGFPVALQKKAIIQFKAQKGRYITELEVD